MIYIKTSHTPFTNSKYQFIDDISGFLTKRNSN